MATERTASAAETERAGARLAAELRPGDVVLVSGDLGAGKTTLVRGALRALGVTAEITSPTFVVGHLYGPYAHLDLYRLHGLADEDPGLLDPYFGADVITFVEWPEQAGSDELWPEARRIRIEHGGGDTRMIHT